MNAHSGLVGADTGGTFTDLIALVRGRVHVLKVPSTPRDPASAVLAGLRQLGVPNAALHYGTTVATNALLERRGAGVVLLTTAGFEDVLEIGRQVRPVLYALEPRRPAPLVRRARRLGVAERVLVDGRVARRLDEREVARLVRQVERSGAEAVAVCLLHAYANPHHERRLGRALAGRGLHVTLSHRLLREYREFERTATTVVNAYVGPVMARHLRGLARALPGGLRVMQSSGGLIGADTAAAEPVRTVLSGPAGGVVGAAARARRSGHRQIVTLDMGGTSTDVSLVAGLPSWRTDTTIDGLPIRVPALDIHTVGAGGGSLVRIDAGGALRVGPESAGADPGPACFGRGTAPTVTDAHLVLGRLVDTEFLGGTFRLDVERARRALAPLARRSGRSVERTAEGVLAVATAVMERAVRVITVERGHDPRALTLVAFGGAGGLHAADLARGLGMRRVWVPPHPGLLSAWGVLGSAVVRDFSRTVRLLAPDDAVIRRELAVLERSARAPLAAEGARFRLTREIDVRYAGQAYEVRVAAGTGWRARFHAEHERRFGHAAPDRPVEVVTVRLRAEGDAPVLPGARAVRGPRPHPIATRSVVFGGRSLPTAIHRRAALSRGAAVPGPAIVCEYSATTVVPPGWRARVDAQGGLAMERIRG